MKIQGSKKNALMVFGIFLAILVVVLAFILLSGTRKKYPEDPVKMKNLGSSNQQIEISSLDIQIEEKDLPLYFVQPKIHITLVEKMIDRIGLSLERKDIIKDSYIEWSDGENTFVYDSVLDSVSFQLTRRISLERGESSFSAAFKRYFDLEYKFKLVRERKNLDGGVTYYASRLLGDIPIQYGANYEYTDILNFNTQGNLESGKLLLAEIKKIDYYIPLINRKELNEYINTRGYPKEHYIDTSVLVDILNLNYLDEEWSKIENTLEDCEARSIETVFLYKTSDQGYLLPVFKILSNCKVVALGTEYTVPTTFYVNAVDPRYVSL